MVIIRLPSPLRPYAENQIEVKVAGATVSEALDALVTLYPSLRPHLLNDLGEPRPFVNLFLGDENVNQMQGLKTPLKESDRLMLLPSIAGGSQEV
jgi:sulfur-carrier protein